MPWTDFGELPIRFENCGMIPSGSLFPSEKILKIAAVIVGLFILFVGIAGFAVGGLTLIPALTGVVIAGCGGLAILKPETTPLALHGATGIALLGGMAFAGPAWNTILGMWFQGNAVTPGLTAILSLTLAILCWGFVIARVVSLSVQRRQEEKTMMIAATSGDSEPDDDAADSSD